MRLTERSWELVPETRRSISTRRMMQADERDEMKNEEAEQK